MKSAGNDFDIFDNNDINYIESIYKLWREDPNNVGKDWHRVFKDMDGLDDVSSVALAKESLLSADGFSQAEGSLQAEGSSINQLLLDKLSNNFRRYGYLFANLDPLNLQSKFKLDDYGLDPKSFDKSWALEHYNNLKFLYSSNIGYQCFDNLPIKQKDWFVKKIESKGFLKFYQSLVNNHKALTQIINCLANTTIFEQFLHRRYIGQKRFSLEGLDVIVPMLFELCHYGSSEFNINELCLGMAHRGRLNILTNFLQMPLEQIISTFEQKNTKSTDISGDVRYHLGYQSNYQLTNYKSIDLFLAPNPSHLESVNPVLQGIVRARQAIEVKKHKDFDQSQILGVLIHGDAAFCGQGVVAETLNYSQLPGYNTQGTIHIIANNQVGFTTDPDYLRSSVTSADLVKSINAPIIHVNADCVFECLYVTQLALEYRQTFKKDIVVDVIGYRRHGHNESDEPAFTQPIMYSKIKSHKTCYDHFKNILINQNKTFSDEQITKQEKQINHKLQSAYLASKKKTPSDFDCQSFYASKYYKMCFQAEFYQYSEFFKKIDSYITKSSFDSVLKALSTYPESFSIHRKVKKVVDMRKKMASRLIEDKCIDWPSAELLALGSLMKEKISIRLSGQDVSRGTFSSRHIVAFDSKNSKPYNFLQALAELDEKVSIEVINSPLSEYSCLGFEFGYNCVDYKSLVLWEAQFGDFVNGAQIIIDQYIAASQAKWNQSCSLVLLLPHGYEGQGPEHSNARPERFLQLCAKGNFQVVYPSTPCQYFHVLRRQALRHFKRALVVLTPKSLLRHPEVLSAKNQFTTGSFLEVIDDENQNHAAVQRLVFCSGKIYYDLKKQLMTKDYAPKLAIIRIEQLYPLDCKSLITIINQYHNADDLVWAQEEPMNMGFWSYINPLISDLILNLNPKLNLKKELKFRFIGRESSATTAEGDSSSHALNQKHIIDSVLDNKTLK